MLQTVTSVPSRRTLEFGIYRDGDNNLDGVQHAVLSQALQTSRTDPRVEFTVEDTTSRNGGELHTEEYAIAGGAVSDASRTAAHDMSDEGNLAAFVARTLDRAEASGARQTWIDLVDHGGGDGGGLQTSDGACMPMPQIAQAIADGVALHAKEHPEDAARGVDGVVANQCLMDTMGFADALSHAHVKWLAASPETMLAPGVPSNVAHAVAAHAADPGAAAAAIVRDVMNARFPTPFGGIPAAAAFDVLDLDPAKIARADGDIKRLNDALVAAARGDGAARSAMREDVGSVDGMVRFPEATDDMPWHADRPAIAVYDRLAADARLSDVVRGDAAAASASVRGLVMAHSESREFSVFGGADYSDAVGPTVHLPTSRGQVDPWASHGISETDNAFYRGVDGDRLARVLA